MKKALLIISLSLFSLNSFAKDVEEYESYYYYDKDSQSLKEVKIKKEHNPYKEKIEELAKENKRIAIRNKEWSGYYNDKTGKHEYPDDGLFSIK